MLIAVSSRFNRPATGFRRRSFVFGLFLLTAAFVLPAALPQTASRPFDPAPVRQAAFRAAAALRPEAPAAARLVDRLIAQAEVVTADERSAPVWEQTPGRVETAWMRVLEAARQPLVELRLRQDSQAARWNEQLPAFAADVRRALEESEEAGVGRREVAAAKSAKLKLDLAQRYAATGEHDRALAEAEAARTLTTVVHESYAALHSRFSDPRNLRVWRSLVEETVAQSKRDASTAFVVDKLRRRLHVYDRGKRIATFEAELGAKGLRQKVHAGDQATPEGRYRITELRGPGRTKYYKALLIDYPNAQDRARYAYGRKNGQVPLRAGIGSLIEIHGDGGQRRDWTDGCVALTNSDMDKVFARAQIGTPVTIVGTF